MADTQEQQYESRHSPERDERRERSSERRDAEPERRERNDDPEGTNLYVANLNFDVRAIGRAQCARGALRGRLARRAGRGAGWAGCTS